MGIINELKNQVKTEVKKPTKKQVVIPILVLIICMLAGGLLYREGQKRSIDPDKTSFLSPGSQIVNLGEVGTYNIYIETDINYNNKHYFVPQESIQKIECKIKKGSKIIPTRDADLYYKYDRNGDKGQTYLSFDIEEKGEYEIVTKIQSDTIKDVVLSVGKQNDQMVRVLQFTVGSCIIMLIGILQFFVFIISLVIKLILHKINMNT